MRSDLERLARTDTYVAKFKQSLHELRVKQKPVSQQKLAALSDHLKLNLTDGVRGHHGWVAGPSQTER